MIAEVPLSRRRDRKATLERWLILRGDMSVGSISRRSGVPLDADQWGWAAGFYPGMDDIKRLRSGTAATFELARDEFERAWHEMAPTLTDENFLVQRQHLAATAWKYRMWDAGCRMPTQNDDGRSRCFCGAEIDVRNTDGHIYSAHMDLAGASD